ncbi:MAG: GGDEF domain-containing protein [Lachnospiraceae bacterium]|nr:GGDEF domain-containing protein [Lachnospiraceae bacterium]
MQPDYNCYREAFFSTGDCVFEYDLFRDTFTAGREQWSQMFGYVPVNYHEIIDKLQEIITPNEREAFLDIFSLNEVLKQARGGATKIRRSFPVMLTNNSYQWLSFTLLPVTENGQVTMLLGCITDVKPQDRDDQIREYRQTHDELTGLLNRYEGEEAVTRFLAGKGDGKCAFILIDIDNFRVINETLGHGFGDYVLKMVARQLESFFGDNAILMRFGGDEFVVFLKNYPNRTYLDDQLTKLSDAMNQELMHHDNMLSVDLAESFGVACYPDHGTTFRRLYECADTALYQAKKRGDHKYVIFGR